MKKQRLKISEKGQSIIEIIVAIGIFILVSASTVVLYLGSVSTNLRDTERFQADMYLQEGFEAVRSIRDYDFNNLVNGTHGLSDTNGYWEFSGTSDTLGQFTRTVLIESVQRGSSCNVISSGGSIDSNSKKVTITVDWDFEEGNSTSISAVEYLNKWTDRTGCGQSSCLNVNVSGAMLTTEGFSLQGITIENTCGYDIVLDKLLPTWDVSGLIASLMINDTWAWHNENEGTPDGKQSSGTELDLENIIIPFGIYNVNHIEFDSDMTGANFSFLFTMTDGTARYVEVAPYTSPTDTTPPGTITNLLAFNPTSSSADLSWTAPGDDGFVGTATTYDVRYSTSTITEANWDSATQVTGEPSPSTVGSSESMTVSGLMSSTTYYFAIKTSDEVPNTSNISNIATITTEDAFMDQADYLLVDISGVGLSTNEKSVTGITIENIGTADITIDKITVSWVGGRNGNNVKEIVIDGSSVWSGNGSSGSELDIIDFILVSGAGSYDINYIEFKKSVFDADITLTFTMIDGTTKTVSFTPNAPPADITPPDPITDLLASNTTSSSTDLSWTAPGDDGIIGTAASYDIRYSTSTITEANWDLATQVTGEPSPSIAGSLESMTVSGLSDSTTYYFAIKTSDEVPNTSDLSNVTSTTTTAPPMSAYLLVDASGAVLSGSNNLLNGITIENTGTSDITIDRMTVAWTGGSPGNRIREIIIDGLSLWSGNSGSGTDIDITDFTLVSGAGSYDIDEIEFKKNMAGSNISITFTMSDASTTTISNIQP